MKQYKVLKEMINAPVGTILTENHYRNLENNGVIIVSDSYIRDYIDQNFIEPYTPEPKHWRAERDETYFWVDELAWVRRAVEGSNDTDDDRYESGNYYRTQATAVLVAKAQRLMLELLHNKSTWVLEEDRDKTAQELLEAIDEAQEACLVDGGKIWRK